MILFTLSDDLTCKGWDVTIVPEDKSETVRLNSRIVSVGINGSLVTVDYSVMSYIIRTLRPLPVPISDRVAAPTISCYC